MRKVREMSETEKKMMEIFQIRIDALKEVNPQKFAGEGQDKLLIASSLAAQEYIERANPKLNVKITENDKNIMSEVHDKYGLDRGGNVSPFLVRDLVCMYLVDIKNGIIDKKGNLIGDASKSEVMQTSHNSKSNGLPIDGIQTIKKANALAVSRNQAISESLTKK